MAQPPAYNKTTNFTEYAAANTSAPYNPAKIDIEYDNVELTLDAILTNLALIQRDDGALKNSLVTLDSLSSSVITFMSSNSTAWSLEGAWLTATDYEVYDVVVESNNTYVCVAAHTSGTFATDLTAVKWILIATFDIADDAVTTAKIADEAVTGAKIADDSIDSNHYVAGSIDNEHLADGIIDNAAMADNAIDLAELAHKTLGELYSFTTSGVPVMISAGTTRQVLQVPTTGTTPAFAGHGGDWGLVLGVADISTTNGISTSLTNYPSYLMMLKGLSVDTDDVTINLTLSDDGASTYEAAGYRYHVETKTSASTSYAAIASNSASAIPVVSNLGNAATETADLFLFIHNADGDGNRYINVSGWVVYRNNSTVIKGGNFIGGLDIANDMTNMKIAPSSGNFDAGKVIIYGIGEGL